jgi:hypothetical protein
VTTTVTGQNNSGKQKATTQTVQVRTRLCKRGYVGFKDDTGRLHGSLVFRGAWLCRGQNAEARQIHGNWEWQANSGGGWKNDQRTPNTADASSFNCMRPGRHLSSWSCMHSLLHTLPLPGLRIKTCLSHNFGIIINYYSQGLKPLSLAPLSNLSSPFPLPTLWKLSPPSLFLRGRSARNDV